MSINGMQGKPRTGKSYEVVVNHIIPTLIKDKRMIVTNLPLDVDHFAKVYGEEIRELIHLVDGDYSNYGGKRPFSEVEHYLRWESWSNVKGQRVYFFIDECHLCLPKGQTNKAVEEFYSMHGHYGFDIMLITQNFRKVSIDIKDMVDVCFRTIKKTALGQEHKYILKVHDTVSLSQNSVVATHERAYDKKYYPFYKSHTLSKSSVTESTTKDIDVWWKHWSIKASVVFFLFAFFIISRGFSSLSDKEVTVNKPISAKEVTVNKPVAILNSNDDRALEPAFSHNNVSVAPVVAPVPEKSFRQKTLRELQFEEMHAKSKTYHPFYKVQLSISGFSEVNEHKVFYFSAAQNGQHIFSIKSHDLILAGYDLTVLSECSISIKYLDYEDFLTCNAPTQGVTLGGESLASHTID